MKRDFTAEEQTLDWWEAYDRYRQSPWWADKRAKVIERAGGLCEGCRCRKITDVHHLRYPAGAWPGSPEWIRAEKLFDLVGVCSACHQDLHPRKKLEVRYFSPEPPPFHP